VSGRAEWRIAVPPALAAVAALSLSATATAAPPGVAHYLPAPTHVHDIAVGPRGEVWFATGRNPKAVGWIGTTGRVHRFDLRKGETPVSIIPTRAGGSAWFSWSRQTRGKPYTHGLARVDENGHIAYFRGPRPRVFAPHELVLGRRGAVWFNSIGRSSAGEDVLGSMTPGGRFRTFGAGLKEDSWIVGLRAGVGGSLWFADNDAGKVGRITPGGRITEFETGSPANFSRLFPPAPGPGGVFFGAKEGGGFGVGRVAPDGSTSFLGDGISPAVSEIGPLAASHGDVWFGIERSGDPGTTGSPDGRVAIGRLDPTGRVTEFSKCLQPDQMPRELVRGPDGNVWFLSGGPYNNNYLTPGIGRITSDGEIAEFQDGLHPGFGLEDLTAGAGRLWFLNPDGGTIGELRPPSGRPNTVLVEFLDRHHRILVRTTTPGPGTLRIEDTGVLLGGRSRRVPGLRSVRLRAKSCGPIYTRLPFSAPLQRLVEKHGQLRLQMDVTFTPTGGAPFVKRTAVTLVPG
jgi:virginiamycin B lyase